jgi:hypothetical protein
VSEARWSLSKATAQSRLPQSVSRSPVSPVPNVDLQALFPQALSEQPFSHLFYWSAFLQGTK